VLTNIVQKYVYYVTEYDKMPIKIRINMELKKGLYKHYKGAMYEVFMTAQHSETEEWMVVYKALYGEEGMWVRPFDMFTSTVEVDGKVVQRFEFVGLM